MAKATKPLIGKLGNLVNLGNDTGHLNPSVSGDNPLAATHVDGYQEAPPKRTLVTPEAQWRHWLTVSNATPQRLRFLVPFIHSDIIRLDPKDNTVTLNLDSLLERNLINEDQVHSFLSDGSNTAQLLKEVWGFSDELLATLDFQSKKWPILKELSHELLTLLHPLLEAIRLAQKTHTSKAYGAQLSFNKTTSLEYLDDEYFDRANRITFSPKPGVLYVKASLATAGLHPIEPGDFIAYYLPTDDDFRYIESTDPTVIEERAKIPGVVSLTSVFNKSLTAYFIGQTPLDPIGQKRRNYSGPETYAICVFAAFLIRSTGDLTQGLTLEPRLDTINSAEMDIPKPPVVKPDLPPFLTEQALSKAISSIDGQVTLSKATTIKDEKEVLLDAHWRIVLQIKGNATTASSAHILLDYYKNEDGTYDVVVNYKEKNHFNQFYTTEIITNLVRLHQRLPEIRNLHFAAQHQDRFAWRHFDGFVVSQEALLQIKDKLLTWNRQFSWGIKPSAIKGIKTPLEISRFIDLGAPFPSLFATALEAYTESNRPAAKNLTRSRYPGELALMLSQSGLIFGHGCLLTLNTKDESAYASYLDSVITFWNDRKHKITRAAQLIATLNSERILLDTSTNTHPVYYPSNGRTSRIDTGTLAIATLHTPPFIDEVALKKWIKTANNQITVSGMASILNQDGSYHLICDLQDGDKNPAGALSLNYKKDPINTDKWILTDVNIQLNPKYSHKKIGLELATQIVRYHYHNQHISSWDARAFGQDVYWWRYFDGIQLAGKFLATFRKNLQVLNQKMQLGLTHEIIGRITSPYLAIHGLELKRPAIDLIPIIHRIFPFEVTNTKKAEERARYPGGVALMMTGSPKDGTHRDFEASMVLDSSAGDYTRFLKSALKLWKSLTKPTDTDKETDLKLGYVEELKTELTILDPTYRTELQFEETAADILSTQAGLIATSVFTPASFIALPRLIH